MINAKSLQSNRLVAPQTSAIPEDKQRLHYETYLNFFNLSQLHIYIYRSPSLLFLISVKEGDVSGGTGKMRIINYGD